MPSFQSYRVMEVRTNRLRVHWSQPNKYSRFYEILVWRLPVLSYKIYLEKNYSFLYIYNDFDVNKIWYEFNSEIKIFLDKIDIIFR